MASSRRAPKQQKAGLASWALLTAHTPLSQAAIWGYSPSICHAGQLACEGSASREGLMHSEAQVQCWCSVVYTCQTRMHRWAERPQQCVLDPALPVHPQHRDVHEAAFAQAAVQRNHIPEIINSVWPGSVSLFFFFF